MSNSSPFALEDYYSLKFIAGIDVLSDCSKIAYTLTTFHEKEEVEDGEFAMEENTHIWFYDVSTGENRQLTQGGKDNNPSWAPDGSYLAFTSTRNDKSQLFLLPMGGGEAIQLTSFEQGVGSKPSWSPDGKKLVFSTGPSQTSKPEKPYWYQRDFYRLDAMGNVHNFINDIYTLNIDDKETERLTEDKYHNVNPKYSPDGTRILYLSSFEPDRIDAFFPKLKILEQGSVTKPVDNFYITTASWAGNDKIVFAGVENNKDIGTKNDLYVLNLADNSTVNRTKDIKLGVAGFFQVDMPGFQHRLLNIEVVDNLAYTNVQRGGNMEIVKVSIEGEMIYEPVVTGDRANYIQRASHSQIVFATSHANSPTELFHFDLEESDEEQLTNLNHEFLSQKQLPKIEKLQFSGKDGASLEGWIWKPVQTNPPYPTILNIHGGPHAGWGNIFQFDGQMLCGSGYAVLFVNHRGSTGYGSKFATKILGDWGNFDYEDLMAGVDHAVESGLADPEKLGCCGISGGGNLSCWIVGHTDRFKAAIPENPLTNWRSFFGVSDIGRWFAIEELGGRPYEIPEIYEECSPITFAHKATTPTLLIQHDNDLRCPPEQTEQFYAILREVGCKTKMLRMPNSPHGGSNLASLEIRETQNREIINWFDTHILGKENITV